jgi:cation diffusion facilitator family transporter
VRITEDLRNLRLTLGLYLFIFGLKLGVYFASNVMALLAEAFHSLADILVTGFLLIATIYSQREPDRVHMFGYGRAQNAAALVAATLFISFTSYKLYEEAIPRLLRPEAVQHQNLWLAFGILAISMAIAAVPLVRLLRQKERGPAAKAQFMELINDELGLIAALVGTLFIMFGQPLADPIAAIAVATIIAYNGVRLFLENFSYLLGRAPEAKILEEIERLARSVQEVQGVHDLRAEYVGPETLHAGLHIEVDGSLSVQEANRVAEEVQRRVHQGIQSGYCYIHVDAVRADKGSLDNEL